MQLISLTPTEPSAARRPARSPLRLALAAATGALLAAGPAAAQYTPVPAAAPGTPGATSSATSGTTPGTAAGSSSSASVSWQADAAVLYYAESAGRVKAIEPIVALRRSDGDDRVTNLRLTLDSLTGASPTGAVPQPVAQTTTSASGQSTYTTRAGEVPVDKSFKDLRGAINLGHEQPLGEGRRISLGGNVSAETDFASVGLNSALALDFNNKNTTLSLGGAYEYDSIRPVGSTPVPLQPHNASYRLDGQRTRSVVDLLVGVTQVMNRRWLTQLNLGLGRGTGYHNDPYKVVSVVDGSSGLETGDNRVSESRPRSRQRLSVYWQNKLHVGTGVVDVALRRYRDDWGIRSTTLDSSYRHDLGSGWYLQPQWRQYRQSAASFYRPWLVDGVDYLSSTHAPTLAYASADPRLARFKASTIGLKVGVDLGRGREFGLRVSSYRQTLADVGNAPGYLGTVRVVDDLRATSLMVGYTHLF